jgi:hypothetical protein
MLLMGFRMSASVYEQRPVVASKEQNQHHAPTPMIPPALTRCRVSRMPVPMAIALGGVEIGRVMP